MAHRTSMKDLENGVAHMNKLTGAMPDEEGAYQLDANIGGYAVMQHLKSGGYKKVFDFDSAAIVRAQIYAWCDGVEKGRTMQAQADKAK